MNRDMLAGSDVVSHQIASLGRHWLGGISLHRSGLHKEIVKGACAEWDAALGKSGRSVDSDPNCSGSEAGSAANAALLCRRYGIYPYYLSAMIAAGVYIRSPKVDGEALNEAVRAFCGLDREVQLVALIADQYRALGLPLVDEASLEQRRKAFETGFRYEQEYGGCAQCSIAACFETLGKPPEPLFQAAAILSGGGAVCTDGSCGSYSGALMVLGSFAGRSYVGMLEESDDEACARANCMGQKLHQKYMDTYGDVRCEAIQKRIFGRSFRLYDADDAKAFGEAGAHEDKCPSVVASACGWVFEILQSEGLTEL
jgi:hypothetical protein